MLLSKTLNMPVLYDHMKKILTSSPEVIAQFLLAQLFMEETVGIHGHDQKAIEHVFYLTRTVIFYIHTEKRISLGLWPPYKSNS